MSRLPRRALVALAAFCAIFAGYFVALPFAEAQEPESNDCLHGFVWRDAVANDHVCVQPESRAEARSDNQKATERREPNGGSSGLDTCRQGFVWREATPADHICVTPEVRQRTQDENAAADRNRASLELRVTSARRLEEPNGLPRFTVTGKGFNPGAGVTVIITGSGDRAIDATVLTVDGAGGFVWHSVTADCYLEGFPFLIGEIRAYDHLAKRWSRDERVSVGFCERIGG